jgi:hypothetical protein
MLALLESESILPCLSGKFRFLHFVNFFSPYPSWFLPLALLCLPVPAYFASKADLTSRIHSSVLFILSPSITTLSRPLFSLYLSLSLFTLSFCSLRLQCKVHGTFLFVVRPFCGKEAFPDEACPSQG